MKQDNEPIPGQLDFMALCQPLTVERTCATCNRWGKVFGWDFYACFNMDSPKWGHNGYDDLGGVRCLDKKGNGGRLA